MLIYKSEQGSEEWLRDRAGVISASNFHLRHKVNGLTSQQAAYVAALRDGKTEGEAMLLAGYKKAPTADVVAQALAGAKVGEWSDGAKNYAFRLAIERISGAPLYEEFAGNFFTKRGQRLEPVARMMHEAMRSIMVEEVGFVTTDDRKFGASADGWIGDDGGAEYKCFLAPDKLRAILLDGDTSEVIDQCQGNMAITGRKWWHFGLYCPALEPCSKAMTIIEVARDDDYIDEMWADLLELDALVEDYRARLMAGQPVDVPRTDEAAPLAVAPTISTVSPDALPQELF